MRALAAVAMLVPAVAAAEPRRDADAHARRGVALYNLGHFDDAITEFEQAYELFQSDALLFNLAQAHRKLDHCDRALRYYHQFLAGSPSAVLAAQVSELLPKLESACRAKDEPPTGSTSPMLDAAAPRQVAAAMPEAESPAIHAAPEVPAPPMVFVTASGTVGGMISGGIASTTGLRAEVTTPVGPVALGGAIGIGKLWRSNVEDGAMLAQLAAAIAYRVPLGWAELTVDGELGAAYVSLLDSSDGVVPGIGTAGQWMPLARAELGAEHKLAPMWALRAGLAVSLSPRVGQLISAVSELDLVVGVVFER